MRGLAVALVSFVFALSVVGCASVDAAPPATAPAIAKDAFDVLKSAYAPYTDADDPLAFPMKVKSLIADEGMFWRGGRDLFYKWCGEHCGDWLADKDAYVVSHGDLHLGNIGTYPPAAGALGDLAFGPVDFDESAKLPYQIELLQGLVTLRLAAAENKLRLTAPQQQALTAAMVDSYRAARRGDRSSATQLADERDVRKLMARRHKGLYAATIDKYTDGRGTFRPVVASSDGELKEVLRPVRGQDDAIAAAIAQAIVNTPSLKDRLRFADAAGAHASIRAVAQRTRVGSSGSQGLRKYLILLRTPLRDYDGDVILYLKEQIPTAAERAGIIPRDPRVPGQRCAEDTGLLTEPEPLLNSWCEWGGHSYAVLFREPWSEELTPKKARTYKNALRSAKLWAAVAGAAHRRAAGDRPAPDLPADLAADLSRRADACVRQVHADYAAFRADPRVAEQAAAADRAVSLSLPSASAARAR